MKVSIILPTYNRASSFLKEAIDSVINQSYMNWELIVIDNNSTDKSVELILEKFPEINLIRLDNNYGYAKGYNEGIKKIEEDVIVFLNNDAVFIEKDSFKNICETFKSNLNICVAQPRIIDYNNHDRYEYAGASGGYLDLLGYPFCRGKIFNTIECSEKYKSTRSIFWPS